MLALARYALKSPFHASTMVGVLAILSLFVPLVSILSGAIVGLVILTQGLYSGARVILVSIVGISIVSYLVFQSAAMGITIGLVQWLPIMVLAEILRRTHSISLTILTGLIMALVAVIAQYMIWPDSEKYLMLVIQQMLEGAAGSGGQEMQKIEAVLEKMLHWTVMLLVAVMYFTFIATLLASRWFQARLAESKGYRDEFYAIRLGKAAAAAGPVIIALMLVIQQDWLMAMLMVYIAAFLFQGIAIAHNWNAAKKGKTVTWLVLMYVMMVIFPQFVGFIAALGVIDNWMNFRDKLKAA